MKRCLRLESVAVSLSIEHRYAASPPLTTQAPVLWGSRVTVATDASASEQRCRFRPEPPKLKSPAFSLGFHLARQANGCTENGEVEFSADI